MEITKLLAEDQFIKLTYVSKDLTDYFRCLFKTILTSHTNDVPAQFNTFIDDLKPGVRVFSEPQFLLQDTESANILQYILKHPLLRNGRLIN